MNKKLIHDKVDADQTKTDAADADSATVSVDTNPPPVTDKPTDANQIESTAKKSEHSEQNADAVTTSKEKKPPTPKPTPKLKTKRGFPILGLLNLLLISGLIAAAFYYWQIQQQSEAEKQALLSKLQSQIDKKPNLPQIQSQLTPLKSSINSTASQIDELQNQQQLLEESTEKLFDLYARNDNDWQLAETLYLMRIASHKLALENDFEGAALTLQAASDTLADTADPGLLPVRVLISEEITELQTQTKPDLVGMTLLLAQMSQQIQTLKPGYQPISDLAVTNIERVEPMPLANEDTSILGRVKLFFSTLITVKHKTLEPTTREASIIDIEEIMQNNLKLTRWTVLERDDFRFRQLMEENIQRFKQYYDLKDAENNRFYTQLLQLQKSPIKPNKPAIDGSLQLLKKIINQRQNTDNVNKTNNSSGINQNAPKIVSEAGDNA